MLMYANSLGSCSRGINCTTEENFRRTTPEMAKYWRILHKYSSYVIGATKGNSVTGTRNLCTTSFTADNYHKIRPTHVPMKEVPPDLKGCKSV